MSKKTLCSPKGSVVLTNVESLWAKVMESRRSYKKHQIYNFFGFLETVAWIWRLIAIFPITLKGPIGIERYSLNKFYAVYGFVLFVISTVNLAIGFLQSGEYYRYHLPMTSVTITIRTVASLLCMLHTSFWRIIRADELSETLNDISKHDLILEHMGCRFNYESSARSIRRYVWITLVICCFFMAFDFIASGAINGLSLRWIFWTLPSLVQIMDLTIFASLIGWLGFKFRAVNEKISAVVMRANASSPKVIITSDVCADNLRALSKAHFHICTIGQRVNSIFDWNVIVNVMTAFIILSTTLYYIFFEVERKEKTNMVRIFFYIHWEFLHSAPIIVMIAICNWTFRQGNYAGKLIHEIHVEKIDSRLYEAIKSFSLQLHHQKLEFTARGLFPLNSTLLQTMVGKITTYLVILIQFQPNLDDLSGHSSD